MTTSSNNHDQTEPREQDAALTTGDVAKMLQVSAGTVTKWLDRGLLKGWRVPSAGGRGHRRVSKSAVVKFAEQHGMPID